jgi:hypothetical protein
VIDNGGAEQFAAGQDGGTLRHVSVKRGTSLYILIDASQGNEPCDTTRLDVTISH